MIRILSTIGPIIKRNEFRFLIKNSDALRLNTSHNSISWHKKIIKYVKTIDSNKIILIDIPGIKPRTLIKKEIFIKKNQRVRFAHQKNKNLDHDVIKLSNKIPDFKKKPKNFYISDGLFEFSNVKFKNNVISGLSNQDFVLKDKKGLNIPYSRYDDNAQLKLYISSIEKIKKLKPNYIGLSFVQNHRSIIKLKKKYPEFLFISKIENFLGYLNRREIIKYSDAIMIDRGDLAAEVNVSNLSTYTENIIKDAKIFSKPLIIATENFYSLMYNSVPTKSDVINFDYYMQKEIDYIMLSDETATSKNWKNCLKWINKYIGKKNKINLSKNKISIEEIIKNFKNEIFIIFSKKGYFFDKIQKYNFKKIIIFTENKTLIKKLYLNSNILCIYKKFPKIFLDKFMFKNIQKNLKKIFDIKKNAILINVIFPRKNSRANSVTIVQEKDFLK